MTKLKRIIDLIKSLVDGAYSGHIVIHFNKGDLAKVEKHETLKI